MIYAERKISVKNDTASIDMPIVLFRGDKNIEILFTIVDFKFRFESTKGNIIDNTKASFGQLAIQNPDGYDTFTEIAACEDGQVVLRITGEMINEIHEVGKYSFHIRLFDEDQTSRITIPYVQDGIEIKEPLVIEGNVVYNDPNEVGNLHCVSIDEDTIQLMDSKGNNVYPITNEENVYDSYGVSLPQKYQTKTDDNLKTVDKTIIGALNEINDDLNTLNNLKFLRDVAYDDIADSSFDI